MKNAKRLTILFVLISLLAVILAAQSANAQGSYECTGDFEATVHQGVDAGWSLVGELTLSVDDSGAAEGVLTLQDGQTVVAAGQVNGRAINLVFTVSENTYIFGVGTSLNDFSTCDSIVGGPLVGPNPGDSGDWGYALGGRS